MTFMRLRLRLWRSGPALARQSSGLAQGATACTRTVDHVLVRADIETVFGLASDIERWPSILPHYRWVRILGTQDGSQKVEMAAKRGWVPVKWTSVYKIEPARHMVYYKHVGGATRGMEVEWTLEDEQDAVRVTIVHEMTLTAPIVRTRLGRWIVGRFFVHHIASRTLLRIKELAEQKVVGNCAAQS